MWKRLLSLCTALALCLSLLPVTALAAGQNTVYVGGVALTGSSGSTVYATTNGNGEVITEGATADNYDIKWDGSTLTLCNATIKKELYASDSPLTNITGAAIGVFNQSGDANLTITLEGTNTIEGVSYGIRVYAPSIDSANLTITGSGTLYVNSNQDPIYVISSNGNAALGIKNAKVTAKSSYGNGVTVQSGNSETSRASLTVDGGSLTATADSRNVSGIRLRLGTSGTSDGTPTVTVSNNAIVRANGSAGGITSNSSTEVCTAAGTGGSGGIVFNGNKGTVYGSVELQENLTIESGQTLTIPDGASLTIDSSATLTNEGTVTTTDGGTLTNNGKIENSGTLPDNINGNGTVNHAPTITTDSLPNGTEGTSYSQTLTATGTAPITWSVTSGSLPTGLTLNESTGLISGTPTSQGTSNFTVTASNNSGSDSEELSIIIDEQTDVPVTGVSLNTSTLNLIEGGTDTLTATVEPNNATNRNVTWSSDNPSVATVNNGVVSAVSEGTATITVTAQGNSTKSASCTVTVTAAAVPVTGVTLNKTSTSLYVGDTETLTATVEPSDATNKNVTWNTSDTSVATVNNGVVTAVSAGTATITVTTADGGFTDTCTVTVTARTYNISAAPGRLDFGSANVGYETAPAAQTVTITNTGNQSVTLSQPTAENYEIGTLTNTTLTPGAAATFTVQPKTGLGVGTYRETITVSGSNGASASLTASFTVNAIPVTSVTLSQTQASLYCNRTPNTITLTATVAPDNATNQAVTWTSSDSTVATVDQNGVVTAVAPGTAVITAAAADGSGASASCTVTVSRYSSGGGSSSSSTSLSDRAIDDIQDARPGDTVEITLRPGRTTLEREVFEALAGQDITLEIDAGDGVLWTVNGLDIPEDTRLHDLDLDVDLGNSDIPATVLNAVTGEIGTVQLSLAHDGQFGFTMTLSAPLGRDNANYWANLYWYNERTEELEFQQAARIAKDGTAEFDLDHASDYAIVIDDRSHEPVDLPFNDVPEGYWAYGAIQYVYGEGLMAGTSGSTFNPEGTTTRGQIVTILWRLSGSPVVNYLMDFDDVDPAAYYAEAIRWATSEGIAGGYGNGSFGPDDPITREQLAVMLYQYAWNMGYDLSIGEDTNILSYADAFTVSEYAVSALQWACGAGLISGTGDGSTLTPQGEATRAQAATVLMRFCELQ